MPSLRQQLADALKPLLPSDYRFVLTEASLNSIDVPTVRVRLTSFVPGNIPGQHQATFLVTVAVPTGDPEKAEDSLDDAVDNLLRAIDELPYFLYTRADKVLLNDRYVAFDFDLTTTTRKDA